MNRQRDKGNAYERQIASELRSMGYHYVTSRSESKRMDDLGVDLVPDLYNKGKLLPESSDKPQLKKTIANPIKPSMFEVANIVIWNKQKKVNKRFKSQGEFVAFNSVFAVPCNLEIKSYSSKKMKNITSMSNEEVLIWTRISDEGDSVFTIMTKKCFYNYFL